MVTCSVFAPNPTLIFDQLEQNMDGESPENLSSTNPESAPGSDGPETADRKFNSNASFKKEKPGKDKEKTNPSPGYVVISGDYDGEIKVFYSPAKPKHSSLP